MKIYVMVGDEPIRATNYRRLQTTVLLYYRVNGTVHSGVCYLSEMRKIEQDGATWYEVDAAAIAPLNTARHAAI